MLEDVDARRETEIDLITGSLLREAERAGIPVPLHAALHALVRGKEASWEQDASVRRQATPTGGH
jgi:2-dehydropantoate 2-reductase